MQGGRCEACFSMKHALDKSSSWRGTPPLFFRRFIDDILFFWTGTIDELDNFLSHMNNQHTHIKFTAEFNATTKQVPFLDTMVSVNEGVISTDLYKKPTSRTPKKLHNLLT